MAAPNTSSTSLVAFNTATQIPLKLTNANYTAWRFQFQTLLTGYDLIGYIDGSHPCPPKTVTAASATTPNPAYALWIRQDQLILSAIIGAITPSLIPFIASANTSLDACQILSTTYGKPSRGRILALKNRLHNPVKGTKSITDFLQEIKSTVDELALLGVVTDPEDLALKVLNGLDESYKEIAHAIQAREKPIDFDELHDKLLSTEAQLAARQSASHPLPATTLYVSHGHPSN